MATSFLQEVQQGYASNESPMPSSSSCLNRHNLFFLHSEEAPRFKDADGLLNYAFSRSIEKALIGWRKRLLVLLVCIVSSIQGRQAYIDKESACDKTMQNFTSQYPHNLRRIYFYNAIVGRITSSHEIPAKEMISIKLGC